MIYLIAFDLYDDNFLNKDEKVAKLFEDMGTYCQKCFEINDRAFLVRSEAKSASELWNLFDLEVSVFGDVLIISRVSEDLIFCANLEESDNVQKEILYELFPDP